MNLSVMQLFKKTLPFFMARIMVYLVFGLIAFIFLAIMIGFGFLLVKLFGDSSAAFFFIMLIALIVVYGGLRFLERYFLYMVKIGHISVIVELLRNGKVPEGKSQVSYGKDQVINNFGTSNVAFVLDAMIHAAVKQIQRWLIRVGNMFKFIPGSQYVIGIINAIMSISLNYTDEAIVSYIFLRKSEKKEETVWKSAADGVVLYAQSWKSILKTSAWAVLFIFTFNIVTFLIFLFPLMLLSGIIAGDSGLGFVFGFFAIIGAYVLSTIVKRAFIDPFVTIMMIRSYQITIRDLEPKMDLQAKLLGVSSRFKKLVSKGKEEEQKEADATEAEASV